MMTRFGDWVSSSLPKPRLRESADGCPRPYVRKVIVFGRMPNPTFDYYLAARLSMPDMPPFEVVDIRSRTTIELEAYGVFVIVCRYASPAVLRWLERNAADLSGVGLLLDDDIPAVVTGSDAGVFYRLFLYYRAIWPLQRLSRYLDVVWASTPHLASTLADLDPSVLPPAPPNALWESKKNHEQTNELSQEILIAYHATGVHFEEHRFLRPIIQEVLYRRPQVRFEVFADRRAKDVWQGLDRVRVREPLPWLAYLADAHDRCIDIMLVPLSPSRANDSRSPTKRIDVARYHSAAIFSEGAAYGYGMESGELRLPYDSDKWLHAVLQLVDSSELRAVSEAATRRIVSQMSSQAHVGLEHITQQKAGFLDLNR